MNICLSAETLSADGVESEWLLGFVGGECLLGTSLEAVGGSFAWFVRSKARGYWGLLVVSSYWELVKRLLPELFKGVTGAFFNWDREKSLKIERRVGWFWI